MNLEYAPLVVVMPPPAQNGGSLPPLRLHRIELPLCSYVHNASSSYHGSVLMAHASITYDSRLPILCQTSSVSCGTLPAIQHVSLSFGQYEFILLDGKGTYMWTTSYTHPMPTISLNTLISSVQNNTYSPSRSHSFFSQTTLYVLHQVSGHQKLSCSNQHLAILICFWSCATCSRWGETPVGPK